MSFHSGIGKLLFNYKFYSWRSNNNNEELTIFIIKNESKKLKKPGNTLSTKEILELYHIFVTNKLGRNPSTRRFKRIINEYRDR